MENNNTIEIKVAKMGVEMKNLDKKIGDVSDDIKEIKTFLFSEGEDGLMERMNSCFVKKSEFEPVKKVVYTVIGLILTAVFSALIGLVILGK